MKIINIAIVLSVVLLSAGISATPLDDHIAVFTDVSKAPTEANVFAVLQAGVNENRSSEAMAAVQPWLNRNLLSSPTALYHAGLAAERSGQWLSAVGYYQRLLQSPKPDRKLADPAADATYRLLLNALADEISAYQFMRKDGHRLRSFGKVKRYDRWFLDEARKRRDIVAVTDRLTTIAADQTTKLTGFSQDFEWLCTELEQFRKEEPAVYDAAKRLAAAPRIPAVVKARLNWVATVMPYNQTLDELRNTATPAEPKLTDPPLAAAAELLKVAPDHGAIIVAKGWGVEYDHQHSGNCKKRFDVEGQRKLDQLLAVVPRLSPDKRDDLLAFPIAQGRVNFDPVQVRKLVIQFPGMLNSLTAANVPLFDSTLTVEEAKKLAPQLARNPHPHAALVRAFAGSERRYSVVIDQMMKTEAWRFNDVKSMSHHIWHSGMFDREGEDYNAPNKKYAKFGDRHQELKSRINKKADSKQRIAAFNSLYKDLTSQSPTIPGAFVLWDELFTNAGDAELIQMVKELTADLSGDREMLLRRALGVARFGKKRSGAMPWQAIPTNGANQFRYHRAPVQKAVPDLIVHLQGMVQKQLQAGAISETVFGMWLHTVDPKDPGALELMKQLVASAAYTTIDEAYHRSAADTNHFGPLALTARLGVTDPYYQCRELLALPSDAAPAQVEAAFKTAVDRATKSPVPVTVIGLHKVATLPKWSASTRKQVLSLFKEDAPIGSYPARQGYEALVIRIANEAQESKQWGPLEPYVAGLWHAAAVKDDPRSSGAIALSMLAEAAQKEGDSSIALTLTRSALNGSAGQRLFRQQDWDIPKIAARVRQVQGEASIAIGLIDVPVDERDPAYPIYKSQAEFAVGNTAAAWELYEKNAASLQPIVRQLTVPYCLWLLEREIAVGESDRAETLIRELTVWSRDSAGTFTPQQEGELKIAYADAAFQKGALQTARAWYRRVADAEQYKGTGLQYDAILRSVRVDLAAKDFDSAMAELDKLLLVRDDELRKRVHYARAEVLFDQENYAEAFAEVTTVLKREPNHADALILLGKAQLEMRKLVDASEIELGISRDQKVIVPGEAIKINLSDPALNISGVGADIEIEIWTKSGDRERVMLHQLGDDKTKFRAEVPTKLAPRVAGDKVLQVLGRDEIRYGYSKRFREKMTDLPPDPDLVITVASDARLAVSAGAFPPRAGERRLDLEELGVSTAQQALGTRRVRPGNPVYLRVTDPDQSKTDEVDEVIVSIATSNGDEIPRLILKETGPHTGEFEAAVPTGRAQALAFASESAPGRDPNMVISAQPYPGWAGEIGSKASEQMFIVDLNDNVALGTMTVKCDDPTQALTHFVMQTSMNGRDWFSRARFPDDPAPWTGRPQITAFPTYNRNSIAISQPEDRQAPDDWRHAMEIASAAGEVNYGAFDVSNLSDLNLELPSGGHPGYSVLIRYRAKFYQPSAAIRTFRLAGLPNVKDTQTVFLIDGRPADAASDDPMLIERELAPGLHTIEVWRHESRSELIKRKPSLLCDVAGHDDLAPCPDSMFDPATFPESVQQTIAGPTVVTTSEDKPNQFDIAFGERARGRLVRLAIVGHKGAAPAIHKITLTDREGGKRLPVATDYQKLRANNQLEIVPGDQVTARYEDDRVVTPRRTLSSGRLSVAYNDATIIASFLNYVSTQEGQELILESIRRFKLDDSVGVVIEDADMDQSREADRLKFSVKSSGGAEVELEALETGPHTGVFIGRVFPVSSQPKRDSEILVPEGGTLTAIYRDAENLDPGIPTDRIVTIEHARFNKPSLAVYSMAGEVLPVPEPDSEDEADDDERGPEIVTPRRSLVFDYMDRKAMNARAPKVVIGSTLRFDVLASHLAFAGSSEVVAYVQTESGRKAHRAADGDAGEMAFDVRVPGTLKLKARPARSAPIDAPAGYVIGREAAPPTNRPPLDEGRFAFTIPVVLDEVPMRSFATQAADTLPASMIPDELAVRPGDRVHIGFAYFDAKGEPQWLTATADLDSHAFLDVMNSRYRRAVSNAYVGEKLYVRLIAPHLDRSPDRDVTAVKLQARSGATVAYELRESDVHSGVFKGSFALGYADQPAGDKLPAVALHGLPVKYGDTVSVIFPGQRSDAPPAISVRVNKGADGFIEPFTKQYGEDTVAIQTTFTLAECFFELAKHHRKMEQESLARREMAHAQKLLAEAIESHRDEELQAHAEYLLGNLAQEYADLSKNENSRKVMYQDALARFSRIPLDYPDTEFAPKAQFKKGLVYEKLGEVDIAVEEYVKLAYKYPQHELIPSVMSRLGAYFQSEGLAYKQQAEELEKKEGDTEAAGEALRLRELATKEYLNAAQVFKKLEERFPNDPLAGLAGLRSAQNYMRAGDFLAAVEGFEKVVDTEQYDDKTVRSQALFWSGISHERMTDHATAYQLYRRVTFDFPDSTWAKRARGRLADPAFARIIEIEQQNRERMLEQLKKQK